VPWPGALAEVAVTGLVLVVAYGLLFWLLAAGDEERALVRRRHQLVRPRLSRAASPQ